MIVQAATLPECRRCRAPMRRQRWAVAGGVCSGCRTAREAITTGHRAHRAASLPPTDRSSADARVERLAARRAAREGNR